MKRVFSGLFLLILLIAGVGCSENNPTPEALVVPDFEYTADGLHVQFKNTTIVRAGGNVTGYVWSFGDGDVGSFYTNPDYTYPSAGTYKVRLTAIDHYVLSYYVDKDVTVKDAAR